MGYWRFHLAEVNKGNPNQRCFGSRRAPQLVVHSHLSSWGFAWGLMTWGSQKVMHKNMKKVNFPLLTGWCRVLGQVVPSQRVNFSLIWGLGTKTYRKGPLLSSSGWSKRLFPGHPVSQRLEFILAGLACSLSQDAAFGKCSPLLRFFVCFGKSLLQIYQYGLPRPHTIVSWTFEFCGLRCVWPCRAAYGASLRC